jgi:hypothetical protein
MRRGVFLAACLAVLSACGVETAGGVGSTGGGVFIDCTPGETFCHADSVWQCTYTGRDAAASIPCTASGLKCVSGCETPAYPLYKACCR